MKALSFKFNEENEELFYKRLITLYCAVKGIKLAPLQEEVLLLFCLRGVNEETKRFILQEQKLLKSDQHYRNIQSYLYKVGLLKKENKTYYVIDALSFKERVLVMVGLDCEQYKKDV